MHVITAVESIPKGGSLPTIFMAGGITDCPLWQDDLIKLLSGYDDAILINPRRPNFPIHDPNAAREQITWEYHALDDCDIFSMWFSAGPSVQPICMYELGRHLALRQGPPTNDVVIGIEPGYLREQDVRIQTELISWVLAEKIATSLQEHADSIIAAVEAWHRDGSL